MLRFNRKFLVGSVFLGCVGLFVVTTLAIRSVPESFHGILATADRVQFLDRYHEPLSMTYQNRWNVHDEIPLHEIPLFLQQAFIQAEDQRFYRHSGQDWLARIHALFQNVINLRKIRGASTLSEQVVRMLYPRPRTVWSKWLEGWEARQLEQCYTKQDILGFYLNQVPFAANRRGVKQAARYYFDRDLETLSKKEMLALAVLVRAPSGLDLYKGSKQLDRSVSRLAMRMAEKKLLSVDELQLLKNETFELQKPKLDIDAAHFIRYALSHIDENQVQVVTTLDGSLQMQLQDILAQRLQQLRRYHVENAALLVADHQNSEILAWVVAGEGDKTKPGTMIDAVTVYRQPGSVLKPLLYALALEKGWTAATLIDDSPLSEAVGYGLHQYQNYSRVHYGPVSLREALGNSLNIPAIRTIQFVGVPVYLHLLNDLGFKGLTRHPDYYGDGLALGNAEVSLLELLQAYAVLANQGVFQPLKIFDDPRHKERGRRIFSRDVSSLIANILSDPEARQLEFGIGSLLNLPVQTAVKTGTSSDYRDSWVAGFNDRYVVALWMGNLDSTSTDGITGSMGPGLVLRSVFALLNKQRKTRPLYLSQNLEKKEVCRSTGLPATANTPCARRIQDYFIAGKKRVRPGRPIKKPTTIRIRQPVPGLHLAIDPRVPMAQQAFEFQLQGGGSADKIEWRVDGQTLAEGRSEFLLWPLQRGTHHVQADIWMHDELIFTTPESVYYVK